MEIGSIIFMIVVVVFVVVIGKLLRRVKSGYIDSTDIAKMCREYSKKHKRD